MELTGVQFANIFSGQDLLLIAVLAMVLFGGKKIGELGKGLGEGIRNFKSALKTDDEKKLEETTKQV